MGKEEVYVSQTEPSVAVLMDASEDSELSRAKAEAVLRILDEGGYSAYCVELKPCSDKPSKHIEHNTREGSGLTYAQIPFEAFLHGIGTGRQPDVVVVASDGGASGRVQGMLDLVGIPFVGSGALASLIAQDRTLIRRILVSDGIAVPSWTLVKESSDVRQITGGDLPYPVIVKPRRGEWGMGITIVRSAFDLAEAVKTASEYHKDVLIEKFLDGRLVTCCVLGDDDPRALPLIEVHYGEAFLRHEVMYTPGVVSESPPVDMQENQYTRVQDTALRCHRLLECRDFSRVDVIVNGDDCHVVGVCVSLNLMPGSLLVRSAQEAGISAKEVLEMLIGWAMHRGGFPRA